MKELVVDQLIIRVKTDRDLTIEWLGASTGRDPKSIIDPFFEDALQKFNGKRVIIDFADLEYINSTTIPAIMRLVRKLSNLELETQVFYNTSYRWQVVSFRALESLSRILKNVTVTGR